MKKTYKTELEGMRDFYEELNIIPDYSCNTDGIINGTLIEFKLDTIEIPLKQLQRYIVSLNAVALPLPHYSLFICINQRKFTFINNNNWKIISDGNWKNPSDLLKYFNKDEYIKGWIDENSIISYNDKFYNKHLTGTKDAFIDEIQAPQELNIKPYFWDKKGDLERNILDCLGSVELKKRLGAFFTPDKYVKISTEYLRNIIKRVPKDYDYIILDRCAGTGNLEKFLNPKELSHCILNTYVYAEWTTLKGLYDGRVRYIIPHNKNYKDSDGLLSDGNALTKEFNKTITNIIEKERSRAGGKLVIIGLENPPFGEPQAGATYGGKTHKQTSWIKEQMKAVGNIKGKSITDLSNQFIWSMIHNYADVYILYAPIKYWKSQHLFDGFFNEGYICNRKKFHATEASISLISWDISNEANEILEMQSDLGNRLIKKIHTGIGKLLPAVKNELYDFVMTSYSGTPDFKHGFLASNSKSAGNAGGISYCKLPIDYIRIPLWVANCYKPKDYTEKEVIMKSGDGGVTYQEDESFLNDCLIWACLTDQNKCTSSNQVINELCLNQNTKADKLISIKNKHVRLMEIWYNIVTFIKSVKEYNYKYNYGLHQIIKEINIKIETGGYTKRGVPILEYKYPDLNFMVKELKTQLKEFYDEHIAPKLFKYELLK